ncbi:MAG: AMP-binding protein [Burkholderiaceae bacterium]
MPTLPLLADRPLARTLAWRDGQAISAGAFLADAAALAERLPAGGQAVNLCQDRYLFAVGLAAAMQRGHLSLLPPNALPQTLRQLGDGGPAPYALVDDAMLDTGGLPAHAVTRASSLTPATQHVHVRAEAMAACLLTSGSTGAPQPQFKRWGQLRLNIAAEAERLAALLDLPSLDGLNLVATVPPQHSYGFESSVLLAWLGGAAFDAGRPFYPADIADALARVPRPRGLVTTPFHLKALLLAGTALPEVDLVLSATAPLSPQMALLAEQRLGARLIEIYGCTEAGQVAARRTTDGEVWTTLGALRIRARSGADGEQFIVEGGHVTEPTPLADVLELVDAAPLATRFRLLGRANDIIHVAGKRSSLAHLNFHLNRIAGIVDGAFWLPDDVAEAVVRPIAFVVAPTLEPAQITAALRRELEPAFVPRRVVHVDALPREATGKLTAQGLREFALATLARLGHRSDGT